MDFTFDVISAEEYATAAGQLRAADRCAAHADRCRYPHRGRRGHRAEALGASGGRHRAAARTAAGRSVDAAARGHRQARWRGRIRLWDFAMRSHRRWSSSTRPTAAAGASSPSGPPTKGPPGWVHGGICALVLDHILGEVASEGLTKPKFTGTISAALPARHPVGPVARRGVRRAVRGDQDLRARIPARRRRGRPSRPTGCSSCPHGRVTPDEVLCEHGVPGHPGGRRDRQGRR